MVPPHCFCRQLHYSTTHRSQVSADIHQESRLQTRLIADLVSAFIMQLLRLVAPHTVSLWIGQLTSSPPRTMPHPLIRRRPGRRHDQRRGDVLEGLGWDRFCVGVAPVSGAPALSTH